MKGLSNYKINDWEVWISIIDRQIYVDRQSLRLIIVLSLLGLTACGGESSDDSVGSGNVEPSASFTNSAQGGAVPLEEINTNVVKINDVADSVTESVNQTENSGTELARLASDLQTMISRFKT